MFRECDPRGTVGPLEGSLPAPTRQTWHRRSHPAARPSSCTSPYTARWGPDGTTVPGASGASAPSKSTISVSVSVWASAATWQPAARSSILEHTERMRHQCSLSRWSQLRHAPVTTMRGPFRSVSPTDVDVGCDAHEGLYHPSCE